MLFLFLTGLLAILGQVVLLRELNVAFFGVELIYILALGAWMCGTALGAVLWPRTGRRFGSRLQWLALASGVAIPLDVAFIRASRTLFGGVPGAYLSFPQQLGALLLALLPVAVLLGLLFQWAARRFVDGKRTLPAAYGIESLGGLAGGLAATLFLKWGVQNFALAAGCALVAAVGVLLSGGIARPAAGAELMPRAAAKLALWSASVLVLAAAVAALMRQGPLDRTMARWNHPALVATRDTPYGRVTVTQADGQLSVFDSDVLAVETQGTAAEEFAHLVAIQHAAPRRVLLLGGGLEGLALEMLKHRPSRIDAVELDRAKFDLVASHLPPAIQASLRAPAVNVTFADPRRFLQTSSRYDVILVAMGEPNSGQTSRFYTREFFEACTRRLTATGVLGFRLQSAENVWTPLLTGRMISLLRAPASVFRDVVVLPGTTNIVLASRSVLLRDPEALSARFVERGIQTRLVSPRFIRYLYTNDRRAEIERTLRQGGGLVNTDVRPVCYQYAAMLWLAKFFPVLATYDLGAMVSEPSPARRASFWAVALLVPGVLLAAARRRVWWRRTMLAATAGFAGMVLETILLLHYQAKSGVLYQDVGVLLTSFMGGLAAGALVMAWLPARIATRRGLGVTVVVSFALQGLLVSRQVTLVAAASLPGTALTLASAGALVAALFAYASLRNVTDQSSAIGPLYAADLAGGAVGAVLGSLVLIPLAGLATSSLAVALLSALALVLV